MNTGHLYAMACTDAECTYKPTSNMVLLRVRPDLSPVNYGTWTVMQERIYQKQQRTSNIIDELWSLTK